MPRSSFLQRLVQAFDGYKGLHLVAGSAAATTLVPSDFGPLLVVVLAVRTLKAARGCARNSVPQRISGTRCRPG